MLESVADDATPDCLDVDGDVWQLGHALYRWAMAANRYVRFAVPSIIGSSVE